MSPLLALIALIPPLGLAGLYLTERLRASRVHPTADAEIEMPQLVDAHFLVEAQAPVDASANEVQLA